jgi:transposase
VKQNEELKNTKYLLLKDKMNLTDDRYFKFESIRKANYEVSRAWQVKENFRDIQFIQTLERAATIYSMWRRYALNVNVKEINEVVETFDRHQRGIINAITTGANNGRAERLNGSIQELKTIGRGYRRPENFRIAILFFHGNLELIPHKRE